MQGQILILLHQFLENCQQRKKIGKLSVTLKIANGKLAARSPRRKVGNI